MRITFILPTISVAGGVRVVLMIAEQLRQQGHSVVIASPSPPQPRLRSRIKSLLLGRGWPKPIRPDLSYFDQLKIEVEHRLIDRDRPIVDADLPDADVVVATWWLTAEWVAKLSPAKGAKAYFIQQLESRFGQPADRVEATWRLPMQKIVCARWLAELARKRFGDSTAIVVPNGVDTELFHAPARGKQPRPTVGFMYAPTVPVKGTSTALAAIAAAARRVPRLHVSAFGMGEVHASAPLPAGSDYVQLPKQEQLRTIYAGCDVWLCSSTSEGFHLPPHEAMACRSPVVSTRVGGPTELIDDGVNGYLVDVGDVEGLADRLVRVINADEGAWRQMSEAALDTARRFTWPDAAGLFHQALQAAIARNSLDSASRP
jgi:glycosyltransferase involved in cell wall biosynthesis